MGSGVLGRVTVAVAMVLALTGCSAGSDAPPVPPGPSSEGPSSEGPTTTARRPTAAAGTAYVALGDSFTSGPGLGRPRPGAGYCQRSRLNWPSVLAGALRTRDFTDLSCAGATTPDVLSTVAQQDIDPATDLVTIGVGGNDEGLFVSLLRSCSTGGAACATFVDDRVPRILDRAVTSIGTLVDTVRAEVPDARVVLVGYLRIMPDTGTCETLRIPAAAVASVTRAEVALDAAQRAAADRAGIDYVSLRDASRGHDACAGDDAWTNGADATPGDGIVFHPRRRGMRAVADVVAAALRSSR